MRIAPALLALPILFASCGGSADPTELTKSGETALGSKDSASAAESFDAALEAIGADTSHPMYKRAKLGLAEAYAKSNPTKSKQILEDLLKALPGELTAKDFINIMNRMAESSDEDAITITLETLTQALEAFPEEKAKLDVVGQFLATKAASSGNLDAASALDGLGYTGGD